MGCAKIFPVNLKEDDTPLDQAIFSSANNAIYGVRGQWVYKFNATTGRKEAEAAICDDALGPSSICELGGVIYVSCWWTVKYPEPAAFRDNHDIFSINPTTLAATNTQIWKTYQTSFDPQTWTWGPLMITQDGTRIWGILSDSGPGYRPFYVVPGLPLGLKNSAYGNTSNGGGMAGGEIIFDSVNNVAVAAYANGQRMDTFDTSGGFPPTLQLTASISQRPCGLCYCPSNDTYYAVDNTSILITADAATMATVGTVNTGEATANPRRIKYCALNGKILVPGWASNSVITINPATNTVVSTQTGFSLPWDICVTNSKAWAVQNSSVGLREITL